MPILLGSFANNIKIFPIVPIRDGVVFPHTDSVLTFGRTKSLAALEAAFARNRLIVIAMQKSFHVVEPLPSDLYEVGTLCQLEKMFRTDGEINVLVKGIARVKIESYQTVEPFLVAKVNEMTEELKTDEQIQALSNHLISEFRRAVNLGKSVDFLVFMNIASGLEPISLSDQLATSLEIKPAEKQELLEMTDVKARLEKINEYLAKELHILEIERKIASKTQEKFDKNVKEAVLRERLQTIKSELGEDTVEDDVKELAKKIKTSGMPQEVRKKADKELKRLLRMSTYNPERSYLTTYLDTLVELPWDIKSLNNVDIAQAIKTLDEDHFGLKKIKERIIEYLAVMKLKAQKNADGGQPVQPQLPLPLQQSQRQPVTAGSSSAEKKEKPGETDNEKVEAGEMKRKAVSPTILCFVGPPGVGKTSIGRSIARALNRKFVKMSLGGIRDEAEIRGHRRTYVGALPGRIIQGIKQAGTKNPVFMLDEIDKVGTDFRGDPSAALLEALDPEQNYSFFDHYLDVPFDFSDVMFITTCNVLDTIPPALRDRLEIIHFAGYIEEEKFRIAREFLWKKQLEAHGLDSEQIEITDRAARCIIQRYTREAGVRNLEREIATIMRKVAKKIAEGKKKKNYLGVSDLNNYLGPYRYTAALAEKEDEIGMVTGLAWTEAGGDVLFIEVALMPGKGNLILTGHLGEVMKESCQAAASYVRSRWQNFGLSERFYQKIDIHIHVPEGAVPKDGPSAGIAITAALVSALTKNPVKKEVGMTGEVTLRGRVLEIGGVKEKIIAAHRAGLKTIILPKNNKKDLEEDIPKNVLRDLKFFFVKHMDEVLKIALKHPLIIPSKKEEEKREEKIQGSESYFPQRQPLHLPLAEELKNT